MNRQSNEQPPAYFEVRGESVRARLLDALKTDLLGPETPKEELAQSPSTRYLIGMLAPQGTRLSPSDDDGTTSTVEEDEDYEAGPRVAQQLAPSSIGLSFIVEADCDTVSVRASWGEYERR